MIPRQVIGPQDQFERTGTQSSSDICPVGVRLAEVLKSSASSLVLSMAAVGTFFEPAIVPQKRFNEMKETVKPHGRRRRPNGIRVLPWGTVRL